ncbi:tRNA lysidine(34) synthetase TilS [Leptothrix sp. BB-4]
MTSPTVDLSDLPMLAGLSRVAVAYSGGRDSTVLLHAACHWALAHGAQVHALHVQHGLSAHAPDWEAHCAAQVSQWARGTTGMPAFPVTLQVRRLGLVVPGGASLEAHARAARYEALAAMARAAGCDTVLLAHHRDDQVETFLLQALRGAGPAGLSAMPVDVRRDGLRWLRPWLDRPRAELEAWRVAHALSHVEDDSNVSPRHARNRLRQSVLPALRAAFPAADDTLSASARLAQDARACQDALARIDLETLMDAPTAAGLSIERLSALEPARRRNVLRTWLIDLAGKPPTQTLVTRLADEGIRATDGRWHTDGGTLQAYRGRLVWVPSCGQWQDPASRPATCRLPLVAGVHPVPAWGGALVVAAVTSGGIAQAGVDQVELRARQGGEQFQAHAHGMPRSLKKQFQDAGVPSSARFAPLIWRGDVLVQVPGLGVDARSVAPDGQPQWALHWQPDPVSGGAGVAGR